MSAARSPVRGGDGQSPWESLDPKVTEKLEEIYQSGILQRTDLDNRALDALQQFSPEAALALLNEYVKSDPQHASNKSALLCGLMKNRRQQSSNGFTTVQRGPDEIKIKEILDRTGYTLSVTSGQRKYGGPPPGWNDPFPSEGCQLHCGNIPREMYESDLIPLFEKFGTIWEFRLMMDPLTNLNRGYAFITYTNKDDAHNAAFQLHSYQIGSGKPLRVNVSVTKKRLFIGNIPKTLDKDEILNQFSSQTDDLQDVIYYSLPGDKNRNRGFCFLEYKTHQAASLAKKALEARRGRVWNCEIIVDWADPQEEPDDDTMSKVKVLYVKNLTANVTEQTLREIFGEFGTLERVKKIKDYAFIHFEQRSNALKAKEMLNGKSVCNTELDVALAKPPPDKRNKEEILRNREMRMYKSLSKSPPDQSFSSRFYPYLADESQRDFYDLPLPSFNWRGNYDQGLLMNWGGGYQHGSNCGDRQQATIQFVTEP